jgi:hypothetical protein
MPRRQAKSLAEGWGNAAFDIVAQVSGRNADSPAFNADIPDHVLEELRGLNGDEWVILELDPAILSGQLRAHPDLAALVSFCGFPSMPPQDWPAGAPPLVVFAPYNPAVAAAWLRSGHVPAAICPRRLSMDKAPARKLAPRESFDLGFAVLTPQTIDEYVEAETRTP